jgi:sodium/bile acid cotransporter 7
MKVKQIPSFIGKIGLDGFMLSLVLMIVLAWIQPSVGVTSKPVSLETIAGYGVSIIFFFYGLRLSPQKLREGLSNWKMHLVVQATTFLFFPLFILIFKPFFDDTSYSLLWLGTFFLASLPSTVSSSVVMVSIAGGNIPAAIFNASISSLLGVFITPLWMGIFLSGTGDFNPWQIVGKLALQVLLPVAVGILLNHRWGAWAEKHKKALKLSDQTVILLIVYTAFCNSFINHVFDGFSALQLLILGASMIALFFFVMGTVTIVCRSLGFRRKDKITVMFCGSKKSLIHGTVMSKVLFPHSQVLGILLLPLMMYHALQIIIASMLAQRMSKKNG